MKPTMHTHAQPEMSQLQRQLLGQEHVKFYTQQEFDAALAMAKAEIMTVAIETTKRAIMIEREECAKIVEESYHTTNPNETIPADWLLTLVEAIRNRIPSQRQ